MKWGGCVAEVAASAVGRKRGKVFLSAPSSSSLPPLPPSLCFPSFLFLSLSFSLVTHTRVKLGKTKRPGGDSLFWGGFVEGEKTKKHAGVLVYFFLTPRALSLFHLPLARCSLFRSKKKNSLSLTLSRSCSRLLAFSLSSRRPREKRMVDLFRKESSEKN